MYLILTSITVAYENLDTANYTCHIDDINAMETFHPLYFQTVLSNLLKADVCTEVAGRQLRDN